MDKQTWYNMLDMVAEPMPDNGQPESEEMEMLRIAVAEIQNLHSLEKQYSERLGELAQLCDVVCPYVLDLASVAAAEVPKEIKQAADEIMDYVESVRP